MTLMEASRFVVQCAQNLEGVKPADPRLDRLLMELSVAEAEFMDAFAREPGDTALHQQAAVVLEAWADFGNAKPEDRHEFMALLNRLKDSQRTLGEVLATLP